jgi:F-type H+-transporting ATPase subunit a
MNNLFLITNPLDQFEIRDLISINAPILGNLYLSLTNILLYLIISFTIIILLSSMTNNSRKLIHNN